MNLVILMGRICKDPDITSSQSGTTIARYSIAVDRRFKKEGEPTADFFTCVSFGKQAEFVDRYLKKGTKIVVTGELQNNNYTNKDGQKVYDTRILTNNVEFAESKRDTESNNTDTNDFLNVADGLVTELPFN